MTTILGVPLYRECKEQLYDSFESGDISNFGINVSISKHNGSITVLDTVVKSFTKYPPLFIN